MTSNLHTIALLAARRVQPDLDPKRRHQRERRGEDQYSQRAHGVSFSIDDGGIVMGYLG